MKDILSRVGDHSILFICETKQTEDYIRNRFSYIIKTDQQPDLIIRIVGDYGVPFQDYQVNVMAQENLILYQRSDYLIEVDTNYKSATLFVNDELALKHALTNLYSAFIVHHNWGLLIHSSCVVENGKAHIFAGHSGAGKSTAAKLSFPRDLLSDEATIVKITKKDVKIYNSPFRSEIESESVGENVELASIQLLHQALNNSRRRINKSDSLMELADKVFFWPKDHEETKTIIRLLTQLVKQVPVYDLHFQKNNTFWELIS